MNLNEMLSHSRQYDEDKADFLAPLGDIEFTPAGISVTERLFGGNVQLGLTDWALQQVCDKLGPPPLEYIKRCPGELRATNLNHWLRSKGNNGGWLVRAYKDNARAVLSKDYSVLQNTEVLETLGTVLGEAIYQVVQPIITPDETHLKLRITENTDGSYGQGVYVGNGETGNRMLRILPFVQRTSCTNSIIWKEGGIELRHWKLGRGDLVFTLKRHMTEALGRTQEIMERILLAETEQLPDFALYVNKFCEKNHLSEVGYGVIMSGTEGQTSRMALANGLSYYAHTQDNLDLQLRLEAMSADVLFGRAKEPAQL